MTEFFKKNILFIVFLAGVIVATVPSVLQKIDAKNYNVKVAAEHIKMVVMTDKNCNDCHLGASFVNLFNHEAVKSNDNVTRLMMDRAKIRQW